MKNTLEILKALSDENRLRIIMMLKARSLCVCELNEILEINNSTISIHLKNLRFAGIIEQKKEGRWVIYSLKEDEKILSLVQAVENSFSDRKMIEEDRSKIKGLTREACSMK
ncbi:MAG: hypothetical protein A2Y41_03820 [Spirochaetes bacterium GWB1_36_13]|nr:MAG: hypothetical protein A2Y41_03820 [Spirochaetes bacterium GWB1_36_13]